MTAPAPGASPAGGRIDLASVFDGRPWSGYQLTILLLAAAAILLDGFDNQALGFALPSIMMDWRLPRQALAPALAVGQAGMLLGAIGGGWLGDRWGRRRALVVSVAVFGIATLLVATAHAVAPLVLLRLVAGVGLGAAFPNVAAFASEFTPSRFRSLAVTVCIVCVPLGGVLGGFLAAAILPAQGWRALFVFAGLATLAIALALLLWLPESIRYLAGRPGGDARIARILGRMGVETQAGATYLVGGEEPAAHGGGHVLSAAYRTDTLALWLAFFFCLTSIYAAFGWLPTLLAEGGLSVASASRGLAAFNMGGVLAALAAGWLIGGFGSRRPMILLAVASAVAAILILLFPVHDAGHHAALFVALVIEGGCVNGVQTTLYALAAQVYPTAMRATGVGAAAGVGRIGAIFSSFLGAAVIGLGGAAAFHGLIAACMGIVALALALITRHQPAYRTSGP